MLTLMSPAARTHDTAKILDTIQPGWAEKVDVESFEMCSRTTDIAAQLDLPYTLDYDDEDNHRLLISLTLMPADGEDWSEINDAWMTEIFDRRTVSL